MLVRDYVDIMASALSEKTGVTVKAGKIWQADVKSKILYYNPDDLAKMHFDIAKGFVLHELGHIKHTSILPKARSQMQSLYPKGAHNVINALEDLRIENKLIQQYGKFAQAPLYNLNEYVLRFNMMEEPENYEQETKLFQFLHLMLIYHYSQNIQGIMDLIGYRAESFCFPNSRIKPIVNFDPVVTKRLYDHMQIIDNVINDCRYATTTENLVKHIDTLLPIIEDFLKEYEQDAKSEGGSDSDSEEEQEEDGIEKAKKKALQQTGVTPQKLNQKILKQEIPDKAEVTALYGAQARVMGQKLSDILKERRATKYGGAHLSGRLLSKNIFKVATNEKRPFSKKINNKPDKYLFYFAIDGSGSMQGNNAWYSIAGAYMLDIALEPHNLIVKPLIYDDEAKFLKKIADYQVRGGTNDSEALRLIKKDMVGYQDHEKIIFILTDGATMYEDDRQSLMHDIEKQDGYIFGIGIGGMREEDLQRSYKNYVIAEDPSQLPQKLLNLMGRIITR